MPRITDFEKAIADGVANGVSRGNAGGGGLAGLGGNVFQADMIARALGQLTSAANQMSNTLNIRSNSDIPNSMRGQFMAESLPFGVGSAFHASRNLSNAWAWEDTAGGGQISQAESMRRSGRDFTLGMQTDAARFGAVQHASRMYGEAASAQARNSALGAIASPTIGRFDQSTVGGYFAQQEEMMRSPHRLATSLADAEVAAARESHAIAGRRLHFAQRQADQDSARAAVSSETAARDANWREDPAAHRAATILGRGESAASQSRLTGIDSFVDRVGGWMGVSGPTGPTQSDLVRHQDRAAQDAVRAHRSAENVAQVAGEDRQAALAMIQAESAARQQLVESLRTETAIMQQRAQRLEGVAAGLGHMQPVDRRIAVNSIARAQRNGWDSLAQQERSAVASADPTLANRLATQAGENSAEFQQMRGMAGTTVGETPGTIAENRNAAVAMAERAQRAELQNRQQTAGGVSQAVTAGNDLVIAALERGYVQFAKRIEQMFARLASGLRG